MAEAGHVGQGASDVYQQAWLRAWSSVPGKEGPSEKGGREVSASLRLWVTEAHPPHDLSPFTT